MLLMLVLVLWLSPGSSNLWPFLVLSCVLALLPALVIVLAMVPILVLLLILALGSVLVLVLLLIPRLV